MHTLFLHMTTLSLNVAGSYLIYSTLSILTYSSFNLTRVLFIHAHCTHIINAIITNADILIIVQMSIAGH